MDIFDEKLCNKTHLEIDKKIEEHGKILDKHQQEITVLKVNDKEYKTQIDNLIIKMDNLIKTIMWGLGIFVTVSLFIMGYLLKLN